MGLLALTPADSALPPSERGTPSRLSPPWTPVAHSPMSLALTATGLRSSVTNFLASSRISMMLFSSANSGARGKEATNKVTKPNWMTAEETRPSARAAHHRQACGYARPVSPASCLLRVRPQPYCPHAPCTRVRG